MRARGGRGFLFAAALLVTALPAAAQLVPDWGGVAFDPLTPRDLPWLGNPVLSRLDIADPPCNFVADPFLYRDGEQWWLFFELMRLNPLKGVIGVASSSDGLAWQYEGVVLEAPEQLSYPLVFRWEEDYYLLPCLYGAQEVRLYRTTAAEFPYGWTPVATLLSGRVFADATLFRHGERWWMLVSDSASEMLWLYSSDALTEPTHWQEHPSSPLVVLDRRRARPAGRVLHLAGDRLIRLAQRSDHVYGEQVRAFAITRLDAEHYAESELPESPVLVPGDGDWNSERMHTLNPWWTGERWLCAVDGYDGLRWSIGIYSDRQDPVTAVPPIAAASGLALDCAGWQRGAPLTLHCRLPEGESATLALFDISGRCLRREALPAGAGECERAWEATDAACQPLAAGLYLVSLRTRGARTERRALLLR